MIRIFASTVVLMGLALQSALAQLLPPLPLPGGSLIVTITSPASGSTVSGNRTVNAGVSIVGSLTVSSVQFKLDGANLGGADGSAPYSTSWNTTFSGNGSHTLTAVARDILGTQFTSKPVTVTVFNAPPPPPPDTTPPTVSITSPANGATVSGTITVTASASDNVGVAGVQFLLDGVARADDTAAPFSTPFNTTTVANGPHTLSAIARDAAGNRRTSATVTITVSNGPPPDTTPPSVSITSPANGATVSGTINVTASASDNVGVAGVQFLLDGAVAADDTATPFSVAFDTTAVANGTHRLSAVARDAAGNRTTSATVTITVSNGPPPDTTPPTVSISSPANGATVSGTINVTASASDNVGVAGVQFLLDGAVAADDTATPFSVAFDTTAVANGTHRLSAIARDAAGNRATSATVTITVSNGPPPDTTAPTVSISSPTGGATVTGTVSVSASASDNVGVAGVQFLLDGAALGAEDTAAPFATSWDTGAASAGQHTLSAVARDAAGNRTASAGVTVTVSRGLARFEENDPAVITAPAGSWFTRGTEIASFSGGSATSSDVAGATATFTFTGTSVSWIGLKCSICGIASVSIDGGAATSVDTAGPSAVGSPGLASEPVFSASGLAAGAHTLVITVTGTTSSTAAHIIVDAFEAAGSRIEENSPGLTATGAWVPRGAEIAAFSNGGAASSDMAGATATLGFKGTAITWIGLKCNICGIATVSIDGGPASSVDTAGPAAVGSAGLTSGPVFSASGLASGPHSLVITVTGTTSTGGAHVIVDAFDVTP
jgi:PKD repeat protein